MDALFDSINFDPGHEKYIQYETISTFKPETPSFTTKIRRVTFIVIGYKARGPKQANHHSLGFHDGDNSLGIHKCTSSAAT